jgi:predicted ABC-type ATPase
MAAQTPEVREKAAKTVEKLGTVKPTDQAHSKEGVWTPERAALQRKIIFDGVEVNGKKVPGLLHPDRIKAATPQLGQKPTFIALGGRGGSGKSALNGKVYQEENAIVLDADHIKGMLPEYAGWNAHQVHEESGHILDTVLAMAKILGVNVVLDATMKTGKSLEDKVNSFKNAGFRTEAHYMHLPRQEAAKRAMARFAGGGETGRYVPPEVVLGNTENEANFDKIKKNVDAWSFHDNNRSKEDGPKLISSKGDAALVPKKIMTKALIRPILFL